MRARSRRLLAGTGLVGLLGVAQFGSGDPARAATRTPNILFVVLDDVGVDQLAAFNPAAGTGALTPNLNAIAAAGVRFSNFYAMPECSPSRVAMFTGRYPLRTGVNAAILDQDLPAAQISPYEATTPRVLRRAGYRSALLGKYHLGGPENNPDGNNAPVRMGWDYFNGNLRGGAAGIDKTLGGQYTQDSDRYSCGFPTGTDRGAIWFLNEAGQAYCDDNQRAGYTGQQGVTLGGIPALDGRGNFAPTCVAASPTPPDFTRPNAYYVWPLAAGDLRGVKTSRARGYMTTAQTDAALAWVEKVRSDSDAPRPWMATVSYNSIHTPYQQPPVDHYPPGFVWPAAIPENCNVTSAQRVISDLMLASLDREIGRLLVGLGLARTEGGQLVYRPESTDTMVVIVGDNGSFFTSVKTPFDPTRAKATPYQTGVLTPLIVAGPQVLGQGRTIAHPVNIVDLFELFGESAGLDVRSLVPPSHTLDAQPMLAYLTNPSQPSIRQTNFSQLGTGVLPPSVTAWPCVIRIGPVNVATDTLFTSKSVCDEQAGTWFGPTETQPTPPYPTSCAVRASGLYSSLTILAPRVWAIHNTRYKLVKVDRPSCDAALGQYEFYDLAARTPTNPLGIDLASTNLLTNGQPIGLTPEQTANFNQLQSQMQDLIASEPACYGDGNLDRQVDDEDVKGVLRFWGQTSVFDVNRDGMTNVKDLQCVQSNLGNQCRVQGAGKACQ